jgi:hypothetical protein
MIHRRAFRGARVAVALGLLLLFRLAVLLAGQPEGDGTRYIPLDHPLYDYLDRLQERGRLAGLDRSLRPYTRQQVLDAVERQPEADLRQFERGWLDFVRRECRIDLSGRPGEDSSRMRVVTRAEASENLTTLHPRNQTQAAGLGFGGRFGRVVFDARFLRAPSLLRPPDSTELRDPNTLPPVQEGLIRPMEGYLKADFGMGGACSAEIFFGRLARNWSPELGQSLILGGQARSFDHLALTLRTRRLVLSHLVAQLDGMTYRTAPSVPYVRARRFLTAHRLDIRVRDGLRFGITETTVYGGEHAGFDLALMNPLTSYRLTGIEDGADHSNNTLIALDGVWIAADRLTFSGQFLFDDFLHSSRIQDRWAADIGLDWRDPPGLGGATAGLRATVASSFVYNTFQPFERYLLNGRPLGAPLGNDYWLASGYLRKFLSSNLDFKVQLSRLERGSGRISAPIAPLLDSAGLPFPTSPVERRTAASLQVRWQPVDWAHLAAEGGFLSERDRYNHPGVNRRRGYAVLQLSLYRDFRVEL